MTKSPIEVAEVKRRTLQTPEGQFFLNSLSQEIAEKFKICYLNADIENQYAKDVLSYLSENSQIIRIVQRDRTSSLTFEYLYQKKPVEGQVDVYFPQGKAAQGIYQRLMALKTNLPNIIRREAEKKNLDEYKILNIGSGPSHEMIEILMENPDLAKVLHVTCVEPDGEAIRIGAQRVAELDLSDNFTFVQGKFQDFEGSGFDMLLLIGILCPISTRVSIKILKGLKNHLRPEGVTVFSTVQTIMGEEDPLTDFIMRLTGWCMDYKSDHEPYEIARAAGMEPISRFFDEFGYNCMTVARL